MPRSRTQWSGLSAVLLFIIPLLAGPPPESKVHAPREVPAFVVEEPARVAPRYAWLPVAGELTLELEDSERPWVAEVVPTPPPRVVVEARTVRAVSPWAALDAATLARPRNPLQLTESEIYGLTLEVSGDTQWAAWATRVIACESGGRVDAVSSAGHYGLAQVASMHPFDFGRMTSEPRYAVEAMMSIYQSSGPAAWSCK